ncbi:TonB-dependent receptor [Caulobacter sp. NIBR1757]|uniref:TonB-dependent receptor n=1 Tax=Caulobacter sp. NIBR1757 TaxID=3016000 RepID=UPI0022F0B4C8|nr:TonB-dependent receptor [Caulobacter sp. NIBR1757]WGM40067.1 Vitamin B12 transporter BtuB [Caulobacter sp. NIBR1757]
MKSRYLLGALMMSSCLVAPGMAAAQAQGEVDEVVITGQRATDRDSLEKKREATSASEIVSGGEAGKLPDQNVAESVRRLSGVSVATDKGEGRYLIIRGIEPNLANVTINAQTASAPEPESRNVKLDDIPSALIGSVQVVKSLTPDLDANAIAGQVDIKTVTAFDRNRTILNARAAVGGFEITDENAYEGDFSAGTLFGPDKSFGVVVALNWSERPSDSEDVLSGGRQTVGGVDLPVEFDNRVYTPALRTRTGAVVNLDWRPTDDIKAYARVMYSKFDDNEVRNRTRFFLPTSAASYSSLSEDGGTFTGGASARKLLRVRNEITDTTTIAIGGEFNIGESLLTLQATHNLATKEDPIRDEIEYRYNNTSGGGPITGSFGNQDGMPGGVTLSANAYNPAGYRLRSFKQVSREAEEDLNQIRIDYQMPLSVLGDDSYLKFGAKWLDRDKFTDATGEVFMYTGPTRTLTSEVGETYGDTFGGKYLAGPSISYSKVNAFFKANPGLFDSDDDDQIVETLGSDYRVQETITAAYLMANLDFGDISVIPGVRVERTEGDTRAIAVTPTATLADDYNRFGSYSYTDVFPGLNLRWDVSENILVRAAITTAIGRPEYFQLAPTVAVDGDDVSLGNPDLKPQQALNLDFSLDYYFPDEGGFSVGLFHKKIDNPIFASTLEDQTGTFGGVSIVNGDVFSFQNGTEAEVTGLELNFQKPFTFLPGALDGFGVNLNATFLNGKLKVPGRSKETSLPKQSDMLLSAQLYYEKAGFSARVAYTYRSDYIDELGATADEDLYFGENQTIGVKAAYKVTKQLEVFAEGNNLNDETDYYFYGNRHRFAEAETYGRSWRVGLSFTY